MLGRKKWYVLAVIALLYWFGRADEKTVVPQSLPTPNTSISIKTAPPPAQPAAKPALEPEIAIVTASRLNVRTGPSSTYQPIAQLSRGLEVTVLNRKDGWVEVQIGQITGWVTESFIQNKQTGPKAAEPSIRQQAPEIAYVDANSLNVRAGPGTEYKQVWTLKANERVTIIARSNDWAKLKGERYDGWVHRDYLTAKPAPAKLVKVPATAKMTATQARKILINRSIALYSGRCPCPYNVMKNGRRCGGNSAYSRPGGASPLCYPSDVSDQLVANFLARQ